MHGDRRSRIEKLYAAARAHDPPDRPAFLAEACNGDEELQIQIAHMLAQEADGKIPDISVAPPQSGPCDEPSTRTLILEPVGQRLGAYTIVSLLGAGGMGQVYRAHDSVLERDVALKTLPPGFTNDGPRLERFHHEAKVLASLNHPNIGAIYGFEQKEGISFLVLELVEGETLAECRSTTRTWPLDQMLRMLAEIVDGLDAAHRKGVIHRDIKPSNIKITPERRVKVLDFGLAHVATKGGGSDSQSSESGRIAGTPAYMSPEQIRGRPLDPRSDIWSFGCLVFELFAGERPFRGDGVNSLATAILQEEPRWQALPSSIPPKLTDLIRRCLEKESARRPPSMAEIRVAIDEILTSSTGAGPRHVVGKKRITYAGLTIVAIALLVAAISSLMRSPTTQAIHSVAVLPFVNASGRADLQYLPDGFTEGIIDRLSQIPDLKVMSRSAVFSVRDSRSNPMEAGRKLRVDAIVTGSIRQLADHVEVGVELADCNTGRHIWGEQYRQSNSDLISFERSAVEDIGGRLGSKLEPAEFRSITQDYTKNVDAYRFYLQGRYEWNKRTFEGYRNAIALYQKALDLDTRYALAWSGIADAWIEQGGASPSEIFPKARAAAERALQIDPRLVEAHASLGEIRLEYDWNWQGAGDELRRALEIDPNNAHAHSLMGRLLCVLGKFPEAEHQIQKAQELDPLSPGIARNTGFEHYLAREYDKAEKRFAANLEFNPGSTIDLSYVAYVRVAEGRTSEAITDYEHMLAANPLDIDTMTDLARAYAVAKQFGAAEKLYSKIVSMSRQQFVLPTQLAEVEVALGRRDDAFSHLEQGYTERSWYLIFLKVEPIWDSVRGDPRFVRLLRKMNLGG